MTPEEREILNRVARTVEENNVLLHKLRNTARWNVFWRVMYWVAILGTALGAFYFLQPYINTLTNDYAGVSNFVQSFKSSGAQPQQ